MEGCLLIELYNIIMEHIALRRWGVLSFSLGTSACASFEAFLYEVLAVYTTKVSQKVSAWKISRATRIYRSRIGKYDGLFLIGAIRVRH